MPPPNDAAGTGSGRMVLLGMVLMVMVEVMVEVIMAV